MAQQSLDELLLQKMGVFIQLNRTSSNKAEIEAQSVSLTNTSKDPGFLDAAHRLLTNPSSFPTQKKDKEILLTSLLKDKFKFEFENIASRVQVHYQQLVEVAHTLQNTAFATYTNIAMALAYTYLQLLAQQPTSLETFLAPLSPTDPSNLRLYNYYFKTLEYIAAEIDNNKFVIDETQREAARERLNAQQLTVLQGLNGIGGGVFESTGVSKENVLNCFEAWISVHYNPEVLNCLPQHSLFAKAIAHIEDDECGESAGNCLRSIIFQLKSEEENKVLFDSLSACTMQILSLVDVNINIAEYDRAEEFVRIIADFARKSKKMLITNFDRNVDSFLRKLIFYMREDLLNTYESLVDVFEDILGELEQVKKAGGQVSPDLMLLLDPLYDSLCHKCQLPVRLIQELNQTEESKAHHISSMAEEIIHNREFTEMIFEIISELQGKPAYTQFVQAKMQTLVVTDEKHFYPMLEVYLYSLIDGVRKYPALDTSAVQILQMYLHLSGEPNPSPQAEPHTNPIPICVRRTFLRVFRNLATSPHKDPEFMYRIMCTTISCFEEPLLCSSAEKAFEKVCEENKHIGPDIFKEFGPVLEKYPERSYIVRGLVTIMCADSALTKQYLLQALTFLFGKFQHEPNKSKRKEYMHSLIHALKAFKESPVVKEHAGLLQQFMRQAWPFMKQVLGSPQRLKDDEDSDVEKIVRILKVIMRTLQFQFSQFLEDLFTTVLTAFQQYPICSYVYLVEVAVTIYTTNPAYTDYLRRLYSDFCEIAFSHMNKIEDIARFSYLLDDFMGMNKRFFLYNASIVLSSGKLPNIIEICMNVFMGCDVPRIAKAAYSFFETIFMVYWPLEHLAHRNAKEDITPFLPKPEDAQYYEALKQFLLQKLEQIISKMMTHLSTAPTEQTRDYILDSLISQIKGFIPENPPLWTNLLRHISSQVLVQQQKERMVEMMNSLKGSNFDASRKLVRAFDRMLVLMNRRMTNANNRKNIII